MGLETIKEQLDIFDKIPLKKQAIMLHESMKQASKEGEEGAGGINKLLDLYAKEALDELYAISGSYTEDPEIEAIFLSKRNDLMANRMVPLMQKQALFVAVGAAHLPGPKGIIALLKEKGYTLTPIWLGKK
jgi:hypothetical protein